MTEEIWKPVVGYEDLYAVSNFGQVKRIESFVTQIGKWGKYTRSVRERILIPILKNRGKGYLCVILSRQSKVKNLQIHGLVMSAFIGKREKGFEVNHKDGNPKNNNLDNLEYLSGIENMRHAHRTGLINRKGIKNSGSKVTESEVIAIREEYSKGLITTRALGKKYGVGGTAISAIINKRTWSHV